MKILNIIKEPSVLTALGLLVLVVNYVSQIGNRWVSLSGWLLVGLGSIMFLVRKFRG